MAHKASFLSLFAALDCQPPPLVPPITVTKHFTTADSTLLIAGGVSLLCALLIATLLIPLFVMKVNQRRIYQTELTASHHNEDIKDSLISAFLCQKWKYTFEKLQIPLVFYCMMKSVKFKSYFSSVE